MNRSDIFDYILQENLLYSEFTALDNIYFNKKFSFQHISRNELAACMDLLEALDMKINVLQKVSSLSVEQCKIIEFVRFFLNKHPIAVLYETVIRLSLDSTYKIIKLTEKYKQVGKSMIFITSSVDDALKIADRISVLDNGRINRTFSASEIKKNPREIFYLLSGWTNIKNIQDDNQLEVFETLVQIRGISSSSYELNNTLQVMANSIRKFMCADSCRISLNFENNVINITSRKKEGYVPRVKQECINKFSQYANESAFAISMLDENFSTFFEEQGNTKTLICVPVFLDSNIVGNLQIAYEELYKVKKREIILLSTFGKEISIAIETSKLLGRSTLLQESHHRIKNNLQVIINLLYMQEAMIESYDKNSFRLSIETIVNRIKSIATVHDMLTNDRSINSFISIKNVIEEIAKIYDLQSINFTLQVENVTLPYNKAASIALLINELINNCVKHAFPGVQAKTICITCIDSDEKLIKLSVADNGIGLPAGFDFNSTQGVGMSIIRSVVNEFKGSIKFVSEKGTRVEIELPKKNFFMLDGYRVNSGQGI